jgi:plasmid stabilization system protein ParE
MTGYDFHPEAALDLDEIWEFIAEANLDAADRVIVDILAALDKLLPFPNQGHKRPDLTSRPLRFTLVPDCLCAGRKAVVDCCGNVRTPQPARDGRDFTGERIVSA